MPDSSTSDAGEQSARKVLVVDDNRDSAISLAMLLKLTGFETRTAHDGLEALEVASQFRPHAIVLDIGLPKLNGYEVAGKVREQPWGHDVVLVAVSGWDREDDRKKSKAAGFDHHLAKPVDHTELCKLFKAPPDHPK